MDKLFRVLRSRRGESMVEILVSTVVFMLLLGALNGAVGFASNAQRKAEQIRQDAVNLQKSVRETPASPSDTGATYSFHFIGTDGSEDDDTVFQVKVRRQTIPATTGSKTVNFYRFAVGRGTTP